MKKIYFGLTSVLLFFLAGLKAQTPNGFLDFGTVTSGTAASTANTGFGGVRTGSGGGGFTLQNPGQTIGTNAELRGVAPTATSINSVGITSTEFGTAAPVFTVSFEMHLSGGASGIWYFFAGNGGTFGTAQSSGFTSSEVFTGLRWTFGASSAITTDNRSGGSWLTVSGTPFAQNTAYYVTIVGNNTASAVNYGGAQSVAANTYDLWINGVLAGNDLSKGLLSGTTNINAFRFYGESSAGNVAQLALDNVRWYNSAVLPPTHLVFNGVPGTGTAGTNLASFTAEAHSGAASGPVATAFTGVITLSKASGSGAISGTLTPNAVAGIATFNDIQFSAADTYTMDATAAAPVVKATSGNVVVASGSSPLLTLTPTSLGGFTYVAGSGPSATQSFTVSGINLTGAPGDIVLTAPADYEIYNGTTWVTTFNIPYSSSTLTATAVDVRLKAGLAAGTYNGETISVVGGGDSKTVTLGGSVTLDAPVANNPTVFTANSFTANWNAVPGATDGYLLDVSTSSTFLAPGTLTSEGFENTLTLFTEAGTSSYFTGSSAAGDGPANSPFQVQGTYGYGKTNGTLSITSSDINTSTGSASLSFRLASFSIGSTGNGADGTDIVTVEISPDGGTNYYSTLRVLGNSNAYWPFSATGIASVAYDGDVTPVDFTPAGGGLRTTDGYSTINITGLPASTNMKIRITLLNNATAERWVIDDLVLTANVGSYLAGYNGLAVAGTSQVVTVPGPGTYYYRVRAKAGATVSPNSNVVSVQMNDQNTASFISATSGDYSSPSSWLFNVSPPAYFVPATQAPSVNNNVTIANGHTITLTAAGAANVLTLQSTGNIELGNNDLLVSNTSGGSPSGYVKTNGTGRLTVNTITNTGKTLPIGNALYNPLIIENGSGHNWSARVSDGVTADPGFNANKAVLVTWDITPSVNPPAGPADITFRFDETTQTGPMFNIGETVQAFHKTSGFWLPAGSPATAGGVTTARTVFVNGLISFSPYALANSSGPLAINVNYFRGTRQGNNHLLNWKVTCSNTPKVTLVVERSNSAAGGFTAINTREATALRCADPFDFTDAQPLSGINYYRLKMVDIDGKISYSGIVALVNGSKGFDLISIAPNPVVDGSFKLNITSATAMRMDLQVSDMQGKIVQTRQASIGAGSSLVTVQVDRLAAGTYHIYGITPEGKTRVIRFVKR